GASSSVAISQVVTPDPPTNQILIEFRFMADPATPVASDSVTSLVHESRRYRSDGESRPAPLRIRSIRAYWSTWRVIWSYLWLKLRARFHSDAWIEHQLRTVHLRNARRIERTIVELQ